jgi:hypothetical protein
VWHVREDSIRYVAILLTQARPKKGRKAVGRSLGRFERALRHLRVAMIGGLVVDDDGQQTAAADAARRYVERF